jgi:hypothetical protein
MHNFLFVWNLPKLNISGFNPSMVRIEAEITSPGSPLISVMLPRRHRDTEKRRKTSPCLCVSVANTSFTEQGDFMGNTKEP